MTTIDSSGIGELVSSYTTIVNRGGNVVLVNLPPGMEGIFRVTQLITVFEVADTVAEAIRILEKTRE